MMLWILGAGGHAKVVIATARAAGFEQLQIADDDEQRHGTRVLDVPIVGATASVLADPNARAVLAIGSNGARSRLAEHARCRFVSVVHPSAIIDPTVTIGAGTVVFAGAIVQPETRIGSHVIVNTGASIDHDCVIGDAVHVAPGVRLAGSVSLGVGVALGIGTVVVPGVTIGAWTTVGAGAAVVRDLPERITAVGVPAREIKRQ